MKIKCRKCGNLIDNTRFCPICGNCIDNGDVNYLLIGILFMIFFPLIGIIFCATMNKRDPRLNKVLMWYFIIWGIIVAIIIFFVVWFITYPRPNDNSYEKRCSNYCSSTFVIEGDTCICKDGRTYNFLLDEENNNNNNKNNDNSSEPKENDADEYFEEEHVKTEFNKEEWMNLVNSDYYVINVIAASWCPHCTNFKPVIIEATKKSKNKLYFIETDKLSPEDKNAYINTYKLENYTGGYPYTFITRKGKVIGEKIGEMNLEKALEFINSVKQNYV